MSITIIYFINFDNEVKLCSLFSQHNSVLVLSSKPRSCAPFTTCKALYKELNPVRVTRHLHDIPKPLTY